MKKNAVALLVCMVLAFCGQAVAAVRKPQFSISTKKGTILQNVPDREIAPETEASRHGAIPGESPTTGLPWEGDYLPVLVQIGNITSTVKVNGREVKTVGVGKAAPWGLQYADILYEGLIHPPSSTRITALFSDCFVGGQPQKGVGPVRSMRIDTLLLREEWQAALMHTGGFAGALRWDDHKTNELLRQTGAGDLGVLLDLKKGSFRKEGLAYYVEGLKAPNSYNADIIGIRELLPASFVSTPRPFLFVEESPYQQGYETAQTVHLDWGNKYVASHFQYNEEEQAYLRYCGAGMNAAKWAPFLSYAAVDDRSDENRQQMPFANVIVQRMEYETFSNGEPSPDTKGIGKGNADIFIGGHHIPGYWIRHSVEEPTVFYDDRGEELQLNRGKTFIAQFPVDYLCTFTGGEEP